MKTRVSLFLEDKFQRGMCMLQDHIYPPHPTISQHCANLNNKLISVCKQCNLNLTAN